MLKTAVDVSKTYGHVYLVSALGGLCATALAAWYSVTLVAVYAKYSPGQNPACSEGAGGCSNAKVKGLIVFITFAMYWMSEWLKNTIHTTISGVYGSWYFHPQNLPRGATRGSLRRALTYSFGSISLGSLVVAIINFLRQLCSVAQQSEGSQGNMVGMVMFWILGCIIGLLDWAVQFLNRYAFSYIALYGKPYFAAAKDTWTMIKDRGIDALVNECLIGPVLSMGATFVGYATSLLAYLYLVRILKGGCAEDNLLTFCFRYLPSQLTTPTALTLPVSLYFFGFPYMINWLTWYNSRRCLRIPYRLADLQHLHDTN